MVNNSIANYTLTKLLGRGGMAEVYEAINTKDQKNVALKLLLPHLAADEVIRRRFLREAKVCMELDHPGIVKVFDVGEAEAKPYMAMELVKGKTLEDLLKIKTFDLEQCIGIALKTTDALAAAHEKKIVHRDIKPRNIMVTDSGIKIMDFGLARIMEASSITDQHEIIGTLYYMSPEQAIGIKVDESSDIFSLGVVLYQMLTGQLPFAGEHPGAVIHAILYSDPLRINELGKTVPPELEQVIFKTLKKKPQLRYRTASELRADLSKMHYVLQGQPIQLLATQEVFEESPRGIYSQLVGRETEMAALEAALDKMIKGESSVILVSGEAGIGKSRLVWELGQKAKEKQARYLLGRCLFGERGYPYQPIINVLRDYFVLKGIKDADAVDAFIEEKASHLSARRQIIHSLLLLQSGKPITLINREQLWDTVAELIRTISKDRPIVLHIDDLHWADTPTLNLLTYLAMTSRHDRLIIMGTYRPEELAIADGKQHPLEATRQLLSKENMFHELRLARLNKQGTHDVVNSVFADSDFPENFYDSVHLETEGNPLFVLEVLNYLQNEGIVDKDETGWHLVGELTKLAIPDRVTDVITHRLTTLTPERRSLLDVAAVEGYTFQSDTLCHVLGEPRLKVLRRLQHLESQHHLVHALEHEYQFDHGKIQETIYSTLSPELKKEYHKQIADYFIKNYGDKSEYAGKIAKHLIEAGQDDQAVNYLLKAGHYAQTLYANEEALRYYSKGLNIITENRSPDRKWVDTEFSLLEGRARVLQLAGNLSNALQDYDRMKEIANASKNLANLAATLLSEGSIHTLKAEHGMAMERYERALSIAQKIQDKKLESSIICAIGDIFHETGKFKEAIERYLHAIEIKRQIGDDKGLAWIFHNVGYLYWNVGQFDKMKEYLDKSLELSEGVGDKQTEMYSRMRLGSYFYSTGHAQRSLEYTEQALEISRQIGHKNFESRILSNTGKILCTIGECRRALEYFEEAMKIIKVVWNKDEDYTLDSIGEVYVAWGDYDIAMDYFNRALEFQNRVGEKYFQCNTLNNIGYVHLKRGDYTLALEQLQKAHQAQRNVGNVWAQAFYYGYMTVFWHIMNSPRKVHDDLEALRRIYEAIKSERTAVSIYLVEAWLACLEGQISSAEKTLLRALSAIKERTLEAFLLVECLLIAIDLEIRRGNYQRAKEYGTELLNFSLEKERKPDVAEAALAMCRISMMQQDIISAEHYAQQSVDYAQRCGSKEILWQAHHMIAKVYLKQKKEKQAKEELEKAKSVLDVIINNLGDELEKIYLKRKEVKGFYKDLKTTKSKTKVPKRKLKSKAQKPRKASTVRKKSKGKLGKKKRKIKRHDK
jgi:predicted ATPase/tRNA A-37 threonylcarbamoyl transferase component Bud32